MAATKPAVSGSEETGERTVSFAEFQALQNQLAALTSVQRPAGTIVPHNGGGVGHTIAETWSAYDQELANRGEHPHQQGDHADWLAYPDAVASV